MRKRGQERIAKWPEECRALLFCHAFIDGLCATGSASAPHPQEALAEPVAHIKTRLTEHYCILTPFPRQSNLT